MEKQYAVIVKNPSTRIHVECNEFKGRELVHIREHFLGDDGKTWFPTKRGVTFSEPLQLKELINALRAAEKDL